MKKIIFSIGIFIIILFICNISNATTISVTPSEPRVGDEITITVTVPNVHTSSVTANVSGVVSGTIKVVGGDLSGDAKDISKSAKFTCSKEGTINIEISSDSTAVLNGQYVDVAGKKSVTVNAKTETPPTGNTTNNNTPSSTTTQPQKSSNASLTNLGIRPNDFSGFKSNKTEYSVEVPNDVSSVEVYATPVKGATVIGTGKVDLKEGDNTVKVKVTAEDGKTTKTYTLTIKRKTAEEDVEKAGEARLKTLGIKPEEYDFSGFNSDKTEYSVEVPNDLKEIEIYATTIDSKAQITGTGIIELKEGENDLKVEVIAQNGTKNTYTIKVTREETNEVVATTVEQFGLSTLKLEGLTLSPSFKVGTYEYTVELDEDLSSLEIKAEANEDDASVEIIGNENLQEGENVITILVTNKENEEVVTYQIIVNKKLAEQTVQTSWLKPSTWGKEEKIKIAIIIVLIILIICAIILKIKIGKENKKNKKSDFPGADELDKAIAEHQELSEEEIIENEDMEQDIQPQDEPEENSREENMQNYLEEIAKNRLTEDDSQYDIEERPKRRGKGRHF